MPPSDEKNQKSAAGWKKTIMTTRYRITFEKNEEMKYTGHLDLYKSWIRIFRRAHIALEHSQGFHPQPKIQLAAALPLGFMSSFEQMDVWSLEGMDIPTLQNKMEKALPPGIKILSICEILNPEKPLQVQLEAAEYDAVFQDPIDAAVLQDSIKTLLSASTLPRIRKERNYDLRPLVEALEWRTAPVEHLYMRLKAKESRTGRPEEVLLQMGLDPLSVVIRRTNLIY
jgi:radical SAM-linked protein